MPQSDDMADTAFYMLRDQMWQEACAFADEHIDTEPGVRKKRQQDLHDRADALGIVLDTLPQGLADEGSKAS